MKYILAISLILNSGLLIAVLGPWPFFLYLSLLINVGAVWYVLNLMAEIERLDEDNNEILDLISNLGEHLGTVHELEMFYGEPILQSLLEHIGNVVEEINWRNGVHSEEEHAEEEADAQEIEE